MTNEHINIAIADASGLSWVDYCNDLNEMHEAEKILSEKEQRDYSFRLLLALVDGSVTHDLNDHFIYLTATAAQRAEAFLRTFGKWEETK